MSHNKIGDVLMAQGNLTEALNAYQESSAIRDRLAKADLNDPNRQRDLAISQGRVAIVLAKQGDASGALGKLKQGLAIISQLVKQSPENGQLLSKDLAAFDQSIATLEQASVPETGSAAAKSEEFQAQAVSGFQREPSAIDTSGQPLTRVDCDKAGMAWNDGANVCGSVAGKSYC